MNLRLRYLEMIKAYKLFILNVENDKPLAWKEQYQFYQGRIDALQTVISDFDVVFRDKDW